MAIGLADGEVLEIMSSPSDKKNLLMPSGKSVAHFRSSRPCQEARFAIVTNVGPGDAVGAPYCSVKSVMPTNNMPGAGSPCSARNDSETRAPPECSSARERYAAGLAAEGGQHRDDDCDRAGDSGQRKCVVAAEMGGDAGLQRRIDGGDE